MTYSLLRAARLFDGTGSPPIDDGAVLVRDGRILEAGRAAAVHPPDDAPVERHDFADATLLPGLVDTHVHLNGFGDGRGGDDLATLPDEILLLQAARNARDHLLSGVTTLRDCGAKGRTTLMLRQAARLGVCPTPRLVLCGRPITITGGHLWYFGQEANGVDGVRAAVRQLVKEGADFIKVAATGGSTRSSHATRAAYTVDELRALVDEAHRFGKPAAAHCAGTAGVVTALDAGMGPGDTIIHCVFREPDGATRYRPEVAERLAEAGVWVDMTLAQSGARVRQLQAHGEQTGSLTAAEQAELGTLEEARRVRFDHLRRLLEAGVKMVSGSDSSWGWYPIGEFQYEVIDHAEQGMGPIPALLTATRDAASCLRIDAEAGTLEAGKSADLLVVDGDPTQQIRDLLRVRAVFQGGHARLLR